MAFENPAAQLPPPLLPAAGRKLVGDGETETDGETESEPAAGTGWAARSGNRSGSGVGGRRCGEPRHGRGRRRGARPAAPGAASTPGRPGRTGRRASRAAEPPIPGGRGEGPRELPRRPAPRPRARRRRRPRAPPPRRAGPPYLELPTTRRQSRSGGKRAHRHQPRSAQNGGRIKQAWSSPRPPSGRLAANRSAGPAPGPALIGLWRPPPSTYWIAQRLPGLHSDWPAGPVNQALGAHSFPMDLRDPEPLGPWSLGNKSGSGRNLACSPLRRSNSRAAA